MENEKYPENAKLISLLNVWSQNKLDDDYELVMRELMEGNAWLLMPSQNDEHINDNYKVSDGKTPLKLTCIYEVDGIKTLGVFTDEDSLFRWAKIATTYTAMKSQAILNMCVINNIYNLVINSDSPNIFIAQRQKNRL